MGRCRKERRRLGGSRSLGVRCNSKSSNHHDLIPGCVGGQRAESENGDNSRPIGRVRADRGQEQLKRLCLSPGEIRRNNGRTPRRGIGTYVGTIPCLETQDEFRPTSARRVLSLCPVCAQGVKGFEVQVTTRLRRRGGIRAERTSWIPPVVGVLQGLQNCLERRECRSFASVRRARTSRRGWPGDTQTVGALVYSAEDRARAELSARVACRITMRVTAGVSPPPGGRNRTLGGHSRNNYAKLP